MLKSEVFLLQQLQYFILEMQEQHTPTGVSVFVACGEKNDEIKHRCGKALFNNRDDILYRIPTLHGRWGRQGGKNTRPNCSKDHQNSKDKIKYELTV